MTTATLHPALEWAAGYAEEAWDDPRLARLLEDCRLEVWSEPDWSLEGLDKEWPEWYPLTFARLTVPADLYAAAKRQEGVVGGALCESLDGKLAEWWLVSGPARSWSNQGASFDRSDAAHVWREMRFRSRSEVAIAQALERARVDFAPNCAVREGEAPEDRVTREPDFLIFDRGRVGILEVDGEPWHPPERAASEHTRDRRFRAKGWTVERFDAAECRHFPDDVVARFLRILHAEDPA